MFLEKQTGAHTWIELKAKMKKLDADHNLRLSLAEFLIHEYKLDLSYVRLFFFYSYSELFIMPQLTYYTTGHDGRSERRSQARCKTRGMSEKVERS